MKKLSKIQSFQLTRRFFGALGVVIILYALSFGVGFLAPLATLVSILLLTLVIVETFILFSPALHLTAHREMSKMLSLGDENNIDLFIENKGKFKIKTQLFDELPYQFQKRNFNESLELKAQESKHFQYSLRPVLRGEYFFGYLNAHTSSVIGFVSRRLQLASPHMAPVYPSVIQMKKYELIAFARISTFEGIKKIRRIGHSYEFEQIKSYNIGDDVRSINWKATGRRNQLMVNQYEVEKAQQVYTIIDKSRSMHMPFNGLSLLDYSINTSLVISNIALKKSDKAGLISFSHRIGSTLKADSSELQLKKILHSLYQEKPQPYEANYDLLYHGIKKVIRSRSLIFLYLNFESAYAMERALPVLQKINTHHLLVVMIFENTELIQYSKRDAEYVSDIYAKTISQKLLLEKKQIVSKLRKYGIQTILSRPEDLSINTVNKYLELKAKGTI